MDSIRTDRGWAYVVYHKDGVWELSDIFVPPSLRRQGEGGRMLTAICAQADQLGVTLELVVCGGSGMNSDQLKVWYSRYGFEPTRGYNDVMKRKPLRPTST